MTEKLFYNDPFFREFTATVLSCQERDGSWLVTLNRTAFYPEGGGQPADLGVLGGAAVTDTREKDGVITHTCDRPLAVGSQVDGAIDWARRFDLMQQHSGEHIVSGLICKAFGCDNVGFHIGRELVTIDFNAHLTEEDIRRIEAEANAYIWADHPISVTWPTAEALRTLAYRSKKELTGAVRIVAFPGADCCACCGIHVLRSGQVGLVKLLSCQKFRDGVRIELAAGGRAVAHCSAILEQNTLVSKALSAKPAETAAAVQRLQAETYSLRGRVMALEEADFARKAAQYAGAGNVLLLESEMSAESVRKLCGAVQGTCGGRCAVFAGTDGAYQYAIGQDGGDLRPLVREMNAALGGRGGGKPSFAQGFAQTTAAAIRSFFANTPTT